MGAKKEKKENGKNDDNIKYFKFPYIKGLSEAISRCFRGTTIKPAIYNII